MTDLFRNFYLIVTEYTLLRCTWNSLKEIINSIFTEYRMYIQKSVVFIYTTTS